MRRTRADVRKGTENYASTHANGTGPFMLKSREPGVRTVLVANPNWWGKPEHNITEATFLPIANAATRVAALISRRDRHDGARAAAGRAAHCDAIPPEGAAGAGAAHDLPGHGPEARRAAVLQREGQEPVQGLARAPGVLPGHRHRSHPHADHARRRHADRPDGCPEGATGSRRNSTSACPTTWRAPRSCSPRPAIRTASKSA